MAVTVAWDHLYRDHQQGLFTLALAITGCTAAAEDAVHEAFCRLIRRGDDAIDDAVAYAYRSVRFAAIDQRRVRRRWVHRESIFADHVNAADHALEQADEDARLREAVEGLPADERETVVLRIYGGLGFQQMSDVLETPMSTINSRYRRALDRLRHALVEVVR